MESLWVEKYRPKTLNDFVFKDEQQRTQVQAWVNDKSIPHLMLSGRCGTGKTSLAKLLIRLLDIHEYDCLYINASTDNGVDYIRNTITNFASTVPFGELKIVFLDESDFLSLASQAALRGTIERFSDHVRYIMTMNYRERIMPAIHSRCQGFQMNTLDKTEFTARAATILVEEGIDMDIDLLDQFVSATYPDLRKCINLLQMHSHDGKLQSIASDDTIEKDVRLEVVDLFKNKRYVEARELICRQLNIDEYTDFYRFMYDNLKFWATDPGSMRQAIIIIRNGLVKHPMAGDPEINLSATLVELEILAEQSK